MVVDDANDARFQLLELLAEHIVVRKSEAKLSSLLTLQKRLLESHNRARANQ